MRIRRCYVCGKKVMMRANQNVCKDTCRSILHKKINYCKKEKLPPPLFLHDWNEIDEFYLHSRLKKTFKQLLNVYNEEEEIRLIKQSMKQKRIIKHFK